MERQRVAEGKPARTYHIWWHGQPYHDAVPFANVKAAVAERQRQDEEFNSAGDYPVARIVSVSYWPDVRLLKA